MPPKKKGVNVIVTGATNRQMDEIDKTINGVKYTLFVPQRDCHNEMGKPYSRIINEIARRENYAQNGDEPDKWIAAIQKVFDNHYDEIKDVQGYKEFHQKKVYFLNSRAGERGFCTYIAVQRKPYKEQTGDAKKKPKRNKTRKKTRKKAPAKGKKGKVSEDGSGFIPAASTSAKKQKIMTKKEKAAKEVMGELYDSNDSDDDEGFDTIMRDIYDMKWNPKSEKYEKIPEQTLEVSDLKMAKSSSSESGSDPEGYSSSASSVLDYGSDASTDDDDLLDAFGNSTAYSIARTTPGTSAYYARMDKYDRREDKEREFRERKEMKKELDDDLLEKVKKGMDVYDAHKIQTERWDRLRDEEEMRAYEDQMTSEDESSSQDEEDNKRRNEVLNEEYARANGWSKQRDKEGKVFYTHNESGASVKGNKYGLLEPHLAHAAYDKAMKQKNTMSSGTSSSTMSLPNVNTGAPKPWVQRTSRSTGKKYWWNPVTKITFYPTKKNAPNGEWTQEDADDAAERAKKKGGKKSRKKKKKTRRKKGGKRKKTKKRKLRKKRKTRR